MFKHFLFVALLITAAGLLCACGSYKADVELICQVKQRVEKELGSLDKADPSQYAAIYLQFIEENIKTGQGKQLLAAIKKASKDPKELDAVMKKAAKETEVGDCPSIKVFRSSAEEIAFKKDVRLICNPQVELLDKTRGVHDVSKRLGIMDTYLEKHVSTDKGKKFFAQLRDKKISVDQRLKLAHRVTDELVLEKDCRYMLDVKDAAKEQAEKDHREALKYFNAKGKDRDLERAKALFAAACKGGIEKACREEVVTNALIAADKRK